MDKKEAKLNYKLTPRPIGVFEIRNLRNGKVLIDSSTNVPGKINRHRFQLDAGGHPNKVLQSEWREFGPEAFEFMVLEDVQPRDDIAYDHRSDLETLEDLWLEKVEPYGEKGYNTPKKTREERLRMIAANRKS